MTMTRRGFGLLAGGTLLAGAMRSGHAAAPVDLPKKIAEIEEALGARMGVAVIDGATGRRWEHRADERFPMCSTFKVLACAAVLARVDRGEESLDRRIRFTEGDLVTYSPVTKKHVGGEGMTLGELCEAGITQSDNTAANLIMTSLGGPEAVTAFAQRIGDETTRLDRWETALNEATPGDPRDTTTPAAMAGDLARLVTGDVLKDASRRQLADWLLANETGDKRLRAGVPKDWRVGDKTGSGDHGTANDVAVFWRPDGAPLFVAVYITETEAPMEARNGAIAEVGRAIAAAIAA